MIAKTGNLAHLLRHVWKHEIAARKPHFSLTFFIEKPKTSLRSITYCRVTVALPTLKTEQMQLSRYPLTPSRVWIGGPKKLCQRYTQFYTEPLLKLRGAEKKFSHFHLWTRFPLLGPVFSSLGPMGPVFCHRTALFLWDRYFSMGPLYYTRTEICTIALEEAWSGGKIFFLGLRICKIGSKTLTEIKNQHKTAISHTLRALATLGSAHELFPFGPSSWPVILHLAATKHSVT